ncbi:MAG: TPR REGION protein [Candidatus Rokubacteria bacterium]|nr:TPR REGION protein [Candidatus Rokubacteria bacterium]
MRLDGDDVAAWLGLAAVCRRQGDWQQEAQAYARALAFRPTDAHLYAELGVAFEAQGLEANAEAAFREALARAPRHAIAHERLKRPCARPYG